MMNSKNVIRISNGYWDCTSRTFNGYWDCTRTFLDEI